MAAAKHPAGSKIPAPSEGLPAVVGDPEDLAEIMRCGSDGRPLVLDDYLLADRPVTGVNVVTFRDRTCLALHWVHSTFDIMGVSALMSAVVLALEDRDDEIPEPHGYTTDPLAELGMHATEKHVLADRALGIPGKLAYLGRNAYALAGPRETRTVCIPAPFWQKMVADVREELALQAKEAEGSDAPAPFVSEGDVLSAWFVRLLTASNLGRGSGATLAAHNSMSIRGVLENDLLPPGRPLLSNALTYPTILHPAREICGRPLSWLAREFRRAIVEQASRSQVEAYAAMQRELDPFMRMPVLCGDSSIYVLFLTNWQKARLFDLDFSAAAARPRPESKPVRASYVHGSQDPCYLDAWPISGKDADGNYWISGCRSKGLWGRFETELAKQNSGEVPL